MNRANRSGRRQGRLEDRRGVVARREATDRAFWLVFALLSIASAALVMGFHFLPMMDFPQHVAQLSAWVHYDDPRFGFADQIELNWFTSYLLSFLLARGVVPVLGLVGSMKAVVLLGAVGLPASMAALLRAANRSLWPSLLGFALAFGYSFYFGFVDFLTTTPLVVLALAATTSFVRQPSRRASALLSLSMAATLLGHGLLFLVAVAMAAPMLMATARRVRDVPRLLLPLLAPLALVLPWSLWFWKAGGHGA